MPESKHEAELALHIRATGLPTPEREYIFHPTRKWRFDFAWPQLKLAVEVEGITYSGGRHQRPDGFTKDCEKYNQAELGGWLLLRYTGKMVKAGTAIAEITAAIEQQRGRDSE